MMRLMKRAARKEKRLRRLAREGSGGGGRRRMVAALLGYVWGVVVVLCECECVAAKEVGQGGMTVQRTEARVEVSKPVLHVMHALSHSVHIMPAPFRRVLDVVGGGAAFAADSAGMECEWRDKMCQGKRPSKGRQRVDASTSKDMYPSLNPCLYIMHFTARARGVLVSQPTHPLRAVVPWQHHPPPAPPQACPAPAAAAAAPAGVEAQGRNRNRYVACLVAASLLPHTITPLRSRTGTRGRRGGRKGWKGCLLRAGGGRAAARAKEEGLLVN
jgi:hypothetical protein